MRLTRQNIITGEFREMEIPALTEELLYEWEHSTQLIQDVLPMLDDDEREFVLSGLLPHEFDALYGGCDGDKE